MADSSIPVTSGSGNNVDVFSIANGNLRQAVVIGDSSITNNVAPVQSSDPTSATQGLVVRDVNTSAIVSRLNQTMTVQFDPGHTLGTVNANVAGTMAVYFDQSAPTVKAIPSTGTFTVAFDPGHTLGAITTLGSITNTVAVFFSPANPSVSATFTSASMEVVPTTGSRKTMDDAAAAQRVLIVGSQTNASLVVSGTVTANAGTGTLTVKFDPGYTLGKMDAGAGTFNVQFDPGHTLGFINGTKSTLSVSLDPGYTLGKVDQGVASTTQPWLINTQGTASIFTASGSASGVATAGNTIISPSANASFKIYAFSIQTTGQVSLTTKFTNGASSGPTEFFRPLITASGVTGAQGANLANPTFSPLFVTGTNTTLSLVLDSATLVHYSVSYIKESA